MTKPKIESNDVKVIKCLNFATPIYAGSVKTLLQKLVSSKVTGKVNTEEWGYLTILGIYQERADHTQYLIFWEASVTNMIAFNRFKLKHPKSYASLQCLLSDVRYPHTIQQINEVEYKKVATFVDDFVFTNLGKDQKNESD